jgi:flagellar motor switch protein FliG
MKSIYDMNGLERAAALLVALGPSTASSIMKHLDDDSIEKLSIEISKIDKLLPEEREDLIGQFLIDLKREKNSARGGESKAREILEGVLDKGRADEIIDRIKRSDFTKDFEFLNSIEDEALVMFLRDEHPQTIAVALAYLDPVKSAAILKSLSRETASEVAVRIAKMQTVQPEAVTGVAKTLKKKYQNFRRENEGLTTGGIDSLVDILQHMKHDDEREILQTLEFSLPAVAGQLRERVFAFENVVNLTNKEIRIVIDEIRDDHLIAKALKGAGDDIRFKFLRNMSQNRATDILNEIKDMGAVRLSEVDECRSKIINIMKTLHENGVIGVMHSNEQWVK